MYMCVASSHGCCFEVLGEKWNVEFMLWNFACNNVYLCMKRQKALNMSNV